MYDNDQAFECLVTYIKTHPQTRKELSDIYKAKAEDGCFLLKDEWLSKYKIEDILGRLKWVSHEKLVRQYGAHYLQDNHPQAVKAASSKEFYNESGFTIASLTFIKKVPRIIMLLNAFGD